MKIEKVEYFGGLYPDPDFADSPNADRHVVFEAPEVPDDVQQSFTDERIEELHGEYGLPGAGKPEQVEVLKITTAGKVWQIKVLNRAISLFLQDNEENRRLHRFLCVLNASAQKTSG